MAAVRFMDEAADSALRFAAVAARSEGKWVLFRRSGRRGYELPGDSREAGETIAAAAERALREETGAEACFLRPLSICAVSDGENETCGMLFYGEIRRFGPLPGEIAEVALTDAPPESWSQPDIHSPLLARAEEELRESGEL